MPVMNIAILRETKVPPDIRVPFTPQQCRQLMDHYPGLFITVQPYKNRCYSDEEYLKLGIPVQEAIGHCSLMVGVKEVDIDSLVPGKDYMFFSHTAKKQKHNLGLLRAVVEKKIRLIDYEYLTDEHRIRLVAFGRWAGFVGAYNAIRAYGRRKGSFDLKPAWQCKDSHELLIHLKEVEMKDQRVIITGGGRVAGGAIEILDRAGLKKISPREFLESNELNVYTQLDPEHYVRRKDFTEFSLSHFFSEPSQYENTLAPYTRKADIFIACHFWDPRSPMMLTADDLRDPDLRLRIIADVSCDVGGPIASTLRASTIAEPFFGYDPVTGNETEAFEKNCITVMSVDNLPGELPRDASEDFGNKLSSVIIPSLLGITDPGVIQRATITENGRLTEEFSYLKEFLEGR
jgi:saccharopine dehydrogenase (NAD+, L-lysine forming)